MCLLRCMCGCRGVPSSSLSSEMYTVSKADNIFLGSLLASVVGFRVGIHLGATTFTSLSAGKGVIDVGSPGGVVDCFAF